MGIPKTLPSSSSHLKYGSNQASFLYTKANSVLKSCPLLFLLDIASVKGEFCVSFVYNEIVLNNILIIYANCAIMEMSLLVKQRKCR